MSRRGHRRRLRAIWTAVAASLAITGIALLVIGWSAQESAPEPAPSEAGTYALGAHMTSPARTSPAPTSASAATPQIPSPSPSAVGPTLPPATPLSLAIPAIGVHSDLLQLQLNPDGTVQVPPLARDSKAGWYTGSPAPGSVGPSVILGHIDSAKYGPGVFFRLGALKPGDTVSVTRSDGTVAGFRVDAVAQYPKAHFPTTTVYGNTDKAALRLITCGGQFDFSERSYEDNIVAFASLVSTHPA